jgi:hypothetical protein
MTNTLTYAELSTITAALRYFKSMRKFWNISAATYPCDVVLENPEIDSLCERLNCGEIVSITGGPKE